MDLKGVIGMMKEEAHKLACVVKAGCGVMSEKAHNIKDTEAAARAAAYVTQVVIDESVRTVPGGPVIRRFVQDGLYSVKDRVSAPCPDVGTTKELQKTIGKRKEGKNSLSEQSKLVCKMIEKIEMLEEDNSLLKKSLGELMKRIENLENDNKLSLSEQKKFLSEQIMRSSSKL